MNVGKTLLALGGVGAVLYMIGSSLKNAILTEFVRIKIEKVSLSGIGLALVYKIKNNQDISMVIEGFKGNIHYGDYQVADIDIADPIAMLPKEEKIFEVGFKVTSVKLISEITRFIADKSGFQKFTVSGTLDFTPAGLAKIRVPVHTTISLSE